MIQKILSGPEPIFVYQAFYQWNKDQFINERRMGLDLRSNDEVLLDQIPSIKTGRSGALLQLDGQNPWPFMRFFEYQCEAGDFGWGRGFLNLSELSDSLIKRVKSDNFFNTEYHLENLPFQRKNSSQISTKGSMSSRAGIYLPLYRTSFNDLKSVVKQELSK
jgi:hypothetical protein